MRNVLITGGAGFFGRGFARKVLTMGAERVCIYSRGEYSQHLMRQEFGDDSRLRFFIGDVRDGDRLAWAMEGCDLAVHAAALKRVEVGQYNPTEMRKTNVGGAENVVQAARRAKVAKVIGLSTDKAFEPANTYGKTKALAEDVFLSANNERGASGPIFAVTRYGNVSGSTGSVIPTWRAKAARGEQVTMTSPHATRFWMTLDQAVQLVIDTACNMRGGELVIPDLPAYRLGDLALAMGLEPVITHLGEGEKLHEGMAPGNTSDLARRMTVAELREALQHV
jgi:FlaA1/EpsC-like NDP-sugar epimerase